MIVIDTNVLIYSLNPGAVQHEASVRFLTQARGHAVIAPQCLYELWATASRAAQTGGLGASANESRALVDRFRTSLQLLPDPPALLDLWLDLVTTHGITGKRTHDARLVAFMRGHGLTRLATFNVDDFRAYPGLELTLPT